MTASTGSPDDIAARPNPIDPIITAGRLYAAHATILLPLAIVIEALKIGVLFALFAIFGENLGYYPATINTIILLTLLSALATRLAIDAAEGDPPTGPIDLLKRTMPAFPGVLGVTLVWHIAYYGGLLLLVIPGVAALVLGIVAIPAMIADDLSVEDAMRRSVALTRSALLPAFAIAVFYIFSMYLIPALADSAVGRKAPLPLWYAAEGPISALISPLVALTIAAFYLQLEQNYVEPKPPVPAGGPTGPQPLWPPAPPAGAGYPGQAPAPQHYAPPQMPGSPVQPPQIPGSPVQPPQMPDAEQAPRIPGASVPPPAPIRTPPPNWPPNPSS